MSAYLHCDGPGCEVVTDNPDTADEWWRLERNGRTIPDPAHPYAIPSSIGIPLMPTIELTQSDLDVDTDDDDGMTVEDLDPVTKHFCSARCGAAYLHEASVLED